MIVIIITTDKHLSICACKRHNNYPCHIKLCNLATQIMAFTSADSNNDTDSVKESRSIFQFISAVCIEPPPPSKPTTETKATTFLFFLLNSLFSGIISKSLSHSASPPGFWCHFQCNTWLMTDICFTCTLQKKRKHTVHRGFLFSTTLPTLR